MLPFRWIWEVPRTEGRGALIYRVLETLLDGMSCSLKVKKDQREDLEIIQLGLRRRREVGSSKTTILKLWRGKGTWKSGELRGQEELPS